MQWERNDISKKVDSEKNLGRSYYLYIFRNHLVQGDSASFLCYSTSVGDFSKRWPLPYLLDALKIFLLK